MINDIELTEGIILLIIIWIACTLSTMITKKNYIDTATMFTVLYALYRISR